MAQPVRYTPGSVDLAAREAWCRANGYEVGPNGWVGPVACAAYRQVVLEAESARRLAESAVYHESLLNGLAASRLPRIADGISGNI